jgi:ribonucleoside-diphosphate reductase alpha chain
MAQARNARGTQFSIDPAHEEIDVYGEEQVLTLDIWRGKYRYGDEEHPFDSMRRVVEGVYAKDPDKEAKRNALEAMQKGLWIPAGRIQAGAGTPNVVTLLNCYMCQDIDDSMSGIADALRDAMLTMQQGGGIGMNFSTLRPSGAFLRRTGAVASGPLPFMDMWDSMCQTIMSAGSRRGAMMAVMDCEHPDLLDFITAKNTPGRLTNFNVSVLITDAFMDAVKEDEEWYLGFSEPKKDGQHLFVTERDDRGKLEQWYVYSVHRARDLWRTILEHTYEWSEPGVIFIDRVNRWNNLRYCETITGTNPCGEQPLPPNGCCNLGAVNLAKMVKDPFQPNASFDWDLLRDIASLGTRFLDNVIDVTLYPLESQAKEEYAKRRIGLGITGLANCLSMMGVRYGSKTAITLTNSIMEHLKEATYLASIRLVAERDPFPLYDAQRFGDTSPVVASLQEETQGLLEEHGIRNGVLLTIAPTGTTSLYAGNVSSGLEPVFLHKATRNVRQLDDSFLPYTTYDYGYQLYCRINRIDPDRSSTLPPYMVTHEDLTVSEHIETQAACQAHIDASVSKTINCPQDMTFEDFKHLYHQAYALGAKGCTSYRYSEVRGSILQSPDTKNKDEALTPAARPDVLSGHTYKIKWPSINENYYITINDIADKPFEVFIQSTSSKYTDWTTALGLMISAIMRKGGDIGFIPEELAKVRSADDVGYVEGKFYGSLVALIGDTIGKHLSATQVGVLDGEAQIVLLDGVITPDIGETCPQCNQPALIPSEGCLQCTNCGYSKCG